MSMKRYTTGEVPIKSRGGQPDAARLEPLIVYSGTRPLGEIEDHAREGVCAFLGTGKKRQPLGVFPDRKTAMRAVSAAAKVAREAGALPA
jgi:hypothetical protein